MNNFNFKNKKILVTGSSHGIGYIIAKNFIECGGDVILNGRNNTKLSKAKSSLKAYDIIKCDLSKPNDRENLVNQLKKKNYKLDILVCNVGMSSAPKLGLKSINSWYESFENNFFSTSHLVSLMSDQILKGGSNIVCISSICSMKALGCPITYSTSKAALNSFVSQEAKKLAEKNIRINLVVPGNILFKGSLWEKKIAKNKYIVNKMIKNDVPLKRFGTPDEVAYSVLFLASDLSSFTTGAKIVVDGGQVL